MRSGKGRRRHFAFLFALFFLLALSAGCGGRSAVYREPPHHPEFVEGAKFSENPAKFKGKEVQFVARVVDVDGAAMQAEMHEGGPRLLVEGKGVGAAEPRPLRGDYVRLYGKVAEDDRAGYVAVIDSYKVTVPRWSELMRTSRSLRSDDGHVEVQILSAVAARNSLEVKEGNISLMPESAATRLSDIAFIGMTLKIRGEIDDDGEGDFDYLERSGQRMRSGFTLDLDGDGTATFKTEALSVPMEYKEALKAVGASGDGSVALPEGKTYRLRYR